MQRPPLARDFVQVVALLPALQAVRLGIAASRRERRRRASAEPAPRPAPRPALRARAAGDRPAAPAAGNRRWSGPGRRRSPRRQRVEQRRNAAPEMRPQRAALRRCVFSLPTSILSRPRCPCERLSQGERPAQARVAHLRLPAPLPRLGGGDEGAAVVGADHAAVRRHAGLLQQQLAAVVDGDRLEVAEGIAHEVDRRAFLRQRAARRRPRGSPRPRRTAPTACRRAGRRPAVACRPRASRRRSWARRS